MKKADNLNKQTCIFSVANSFSFDANFLEKFGVKDEFISSLEL